MLTEDLIKKNREKIAELIKNEIKKQNIAIEEIERQGISKHTVYSIIQAKNYNINSLLVVVEILRKENKLFKIIV